MGRVRPRSSPKKGSMKGVGQWGRVWHLLLLRSCPSLGVGWGGVGWEGKFPGQGEKRGHLVSSAVTGGWRRGPSFGEPHSWVQTWGGIWRVGSLLRAGRGCAVVPERARGGAGGRAGSWAGSSAAVGVDWGVRPGRQAQEQQQQLQRRQDAQRGQEGRSAAAV